MHTKFVLFLVVIAVNAIPQPSKSHKIREILDQSFNEFIQSKVYADLIAKEKEFQHKTEKEPKSKAKVNYHQNRLSSKYRQHFHYEREQRFPSADGKPTRSPPHLQKRLEQQSAMPIRFLNDYTYLHLDEKYSCTTVGQKVGLLTTDTTWGSLDCTADDLLTQERIDYLKDPQVGVIAGAQKLLSQFLTLNPDQVQDPLTLNPSATNCRSSSAPSDYMRINATYRNPGVVGYDFIIYWSARPEGGPLASSQICGRHFLATSNGVDHYDRPTMSSINIDPSNFFQETKELGTTQFAFEQLVRIVLHEIIHSLGFTSNVYQDWVDASSEAPAFPAQAWWPQPTVDMTTTRNEGTVYQFGVTTTNVLNYGKTYFNCSSLIGVPLENQDGGQLRNVPGSHWEERLFPSEIMAPLADFSRTVLSGFTLSALRDMGWYTVDMDYAEPKRFGYLEGCNFVTGSCANWNPVDFCLSTANEEGCDAEYGSGAFCELKDYSTALPSEFQYVPGKPDEGGGSVYADYCVTQQPYSNHHCQLTTEAHRGDGFADEIFGSQSACFNTRVNNVKGFRCYRWRCAHSNSGAILQFQSKSDSNWHNCPIDGGNVTTSIGQIQCPRSRIFCDWTTATQDSGRFDSSGGGVLHVVSLVLVPLILLFVFIY